MTDLIKQARELCASATPGPWKVEQKGNTVKSMAIKGVCCGMSAMRDDYHFIAASRTLVPALADALEEAQKEKEKIKTSLAEACRDKEKIFNLAQEEVTRSIEWKHRAEKAEAELKAAVEDIYLLEECSVCKNSYETKRGIACSIDGTECNFVWRGIEKGETDGQNS